MEKIQKELGIQITEDFQHVLTTSSTKSSSAHQSDKLSLAQLTNACSVVSVLEDTNIRMDILKWFIGE